jgi:adenylosuccinate synthase
MNRCVTIVIGWQFGSEAKGKVIQYLAKEFDIAVRWWSPNAWHTVVTSDTTYKLQQIPATFLHKNCALYIGAWAVIDQEILERELLLPWIKERLMVDNTCIMITNEHKESESDIIHSIWSTWKWCWAALINRIQRKNFQLAQDALKNICTLWDVSYEVNKGIDNNKNILLEWCQWFGLSLYHGTYPYVTSRDTTAWGLLAEIGISPLVVKDIILVIRTYPIRVAWNSWPMYNEISWDTLSSRIWKKVIERTTVTNNIRRIWEFDIDIVKKAILINRPTQIALQFLNYLFPTDEGKTQRIDLSNEAKTYILHLEEDIWVPITLIWTWIHEQEIIDRR